ncbi:MAG: proteasome subunit beta [archaeon]
MDVVKTGTTTLGMMCKDGIILAADRRATAGTFIAYKKTEKVIPINEHMALTTAGSVSDIQLMVKLLKAELSLKDIRTGRSATVEEAANLLAGMVYHNIRKMSMMPGISHFIFAGYDQNGPAMYDIYPDGSIQQVDEFVCSGSGSTFAYGLFEAQYKKGLSATDAQDLAVKAVTSALQRDSASGDGIDVVLITKNGIKKVFDKSFNPAQ